MVSSLFFQVAPVSVLLRHLQRSLSERCSWRLQKDIYRLRSMTQMSALMSLAGHNALAKHQAEWDSLLALHDPRWMAVTIQMRRLVQQVQSADRTLAERAQTPTPDPGSLGNGSSASSSVN